MLSISALHSVSIALIHRQPYISRRRDSGRWEGVPVAAWVDRLLSQAAQQPVIGLVHTTVGPFADAGSGYVPGRIRVALYDQTHTLLGSCADGANGYGIQCFDPQVAVFQAPK